MHLHHDDDDGFARFVPGFGESHEPVVSSGGVVPVERTGLAAEPERLEVLAGHVPWGHVLVRGALRHGAQHRFAEAVIRVFAELADVQRDGLLRGERRHVAGPWDFERLFGEDGADLCCGEKRRQCGRGRKAAGDFGKAVARVRGGIAGGVRGVARELPVVAEFCGGGEQALGADVFPDDGHGRVRGAGECFSEFHRGSVVFFGNTQLSQVERVVAPDHRDRRVERVAVALHGGRNRDELGQRCGGEGGPPDVVGFALDLVVASFTPGDDFVCLCIDDEDDAQVRVVAAQENVYFIGEERVFLRLDVIHITTACGRDAIVVGAGGRFFEVFVLDAGEP